MFGTFYVWYTGWYTKCVGSRFVGTSSSFLTHRDRSWSFWVRLVKCYVWYTSCIWYSEDILTVPNATGVPNVTLFSILGIIPSAFWSHFCTFYIVQAIAQSTAETKLFPFSKNKRSPFRLRIRPYRSNRRAILPLTTKFRPNRATGGGVMTSYTISRWRQRWINTTSSFVRKVKN